MNNTYIFTDLEKSRLKSAVKQMIAHIKETECDACDALTYCRYCRDGVYSEICDYNEILKKLGES